MWFLFSSRKLNTTPAFEKSKAPSIDTAREYSIFHFIAALSKAFQCRWIIMHVDLFLQEPQANQMSVSQPILKSAF